MDDIDRKVVIIIDTGINIDTFKESIVGGIHFFNIEDTLYCDDNFEDYHGHGTACAHVIHSIYPDAKFYIIKALDDNAEGNYPILKAALNHCLELQYSIINLSLAMLKEDKDKGLHNLCELLMKNGKIIVSSVYNGRHHSYPAIYSSVIGVRGGRFSNQNNFWFENNKSIQCVADKTHLFTSRLYPKTFMFGGNSKACALMAGKILQLSECTQNLNFNNVSHLLENNAEKNQWNKKEINNTKGLCLNENNIPKKLDEKYLYDIYKILQLIMEDNLSIVSLDWDDNIFEMYLKASDSLSLISNLEKYYKIILPLEKMNYNSICSARMIAYTIERSAFNEKY